MSSTPIIDLLTAGRPILGALAKAGKAVISTRLQKNTDMPAATADAASESPNAQALVEIAENPNVALIAVKPAFMSRINWTQLIGPACSVLAIFGLDLTPEQITAVVVGFQTIQSIVTWILRTWFNHSITPAAADRAVANGKAV